MEKSTTGIVIFLVGILILVQSFTQQANAQIPYAIIGIALIIGGLWYAAKK